jgi:hypothetical protein
MILLMRKLWLLLCMALLIPVSLATQRGGYHRPYTADIKHKPTLRRSSEKEKLKRRAAGRERALERERAERK